MSDETRRAALILIAAAIALGVAAYVFAPAERCAVVPALQIGSSGPRC